MSTHEVIMYRVICDRCGTCAQDGTDFWAWNDPDTARDDARCADWLFVGDDEQFCADCYVPSEECDGEGVPLPPIPAQQRGVAP